MQRFGLTVVIGTACLVSVPAPAWADSTGDVTATVIVTGGELSIITPATADLGEGSPDEGITGQLGTVTVIDDRAQLAATWVVTVTASDFTTGGATPAETIPASAIDYWSGPATQNVGTGVLVPGQPTAADAVPIVSTPTAFTRSTGDGLNRASWNPTLTFQLGPETVTGVYTGTVTHSVA
ncbi:hypothetical protein V6V47_20395 [Micromonospora sp. CPCC 205539]|uniref:hypothetical protein n=1 Tax=Micromonospora sp. CPCC 205539 TaxID=3122408 RepID=UPI002FF171B0